MKTQKVKVMVSLRRVVLASSAWSILALSVASCSDDERPRSQPTDVDADVDAGPTIPPSDTGVSDSPVDASDEVPDEPVVCDTEPCPVDIVAGRNHFCVLMSDKTLRCWGDDGVGQLGAGKALADDDGQSPVRTVQGVANAMQISASGTTSCALLSSGGVSCWGGNDQAQLGLSVEPPAADGDRHPTPSPVALPETGASRVDVGVQSACAILVDGEVFCWGANDQAQLGRPASEPLGGPANVKSLTGKIARTAAGTHTAFAVDGVGRIQSWGATADYAGIIAGRESSLTPDPVPAVLAVEGVTSLAASAWHYEYVDGVDRSLAHACVTARGNAYCWGDSMYGAMGFGAPFVFVRPTLVPVRSKARAQQVAVSLENTCLRMSDGSIQCAGDDARRQLGRGADGGLFSDVFTPATELKEHALRLALSDSTTCVIVRGGKVMCWGGNAHGELAQGSPDDGAHPTPAAVTF